ncbi:PQQ-dependent sugar dehydrogenase [bacterium]|nr:PQQ-dependent sugar dehydrogenase [bacterium]
MTKKILLCLWSLSLLTGCSSESGTDNSTTAPSDIRMVAAFPNLTFEQPLDLAWPDDGTNRLFIVEQPGRIWMIENDSTTSDRTLFLDITARVEDEGWEEGLLGLAFHPEYATNGYFYVNYTATNPDRTVISRFTVEPTDPNAADPASEHEILSFRQPYSNHNGGCLKFGPDGYLYIGVGDGGSAGDPQGNGQDRTSLLGTILRIDIDNPAGGNAYGIPADNPFAGNSDGYAEEIYAWGLRNPWRFSFDPPTGRLWAADVGQNRIEEVDLIVSGGNYGWDIMEGSECYEAMTCDTAGLILPVAEYQHSQGKSITGGFVYRGSLVPELTGMYIYADFLSGRVWGLTYNQGAGSPSLLVNSGLSIASFGIDRSNELYALAFDGKIYRFDSVSK